MRWYKASLHCTVSVGACVDSKQTWKVLLQYFKRDHLFFPQPIYSHFSVVKSSPIKHNPDTILSVYCFYHPQLISHLHVWGTRKSADRLTKLRNGELDTSVLNSHNLSCWRYPGNPIKMSKPVSPPDCQQSWWSSQRDRILRINKIILFQLYNMEVECDQK